MRLVKKLQTIGFKKNDMVSLEFSYYKYLRTYRQVTYNDLDKENLIALLKDLFNLESKRISKNIIDDFEKYLRPNSRDIFEYNSLVNFLDQRILFKFSNCFDPKDCDITIDYFTTMKFGRLIKKSKTLEKMNILKLVRVFRNNYKVGLALK